MLWTDEQIRERAAGIYRKWEKKLLLSGENDDLQAMYDAAREVRDHYQQRIADLEIVVEDRKRRVYDLETENVNFIRIQEGYRQRMNELEAELAKLREQVSTMHTVAGKVAQSGGDNLTLMAKDWQSEVKRLRDENITLSMRLAADDEETRWKIYHLEAENAKLRALLPGPEVISAIRDVIDGWEHSGLDEYHGSPRHAYDSESVVKVEAWLDSIEAEKEAGDG